MILFTHILPIDIKNKKSCNSKDYVIQPCESESDYEKIFFIIKKNTFCIEENKILLMYLLFFMSKNIFFNQFILDFAQISFCIYMVLFRNI